VNKPLTTARPLSRWLGVAVASALVVTGAVAGAALPAAAEAPYLVTGKLTGIPVADATPEQLANVAVDVILVASTGAVTIVDSTATDANGDFDFALAEPGNYTLGFNCAGPGLSCNVDYPVEFLGQASDAQHALTFPLGEESAESVQDYVLSAGSTITGTVRDSAGEPAPGAYVSAFRPGQQVSSNVQADSNGFYELTRVPADGLIVKAVYYDTRSAQERRFWADTYFGNTADSADAVPVYTTAGSTQADNDITLEVLPSVRIHVVDEAGVPISGVDVVPYKLDEATGTYVAPNAGDALGTNVDGWLGKRVQRGETYKFFVVDARFPSVDDTETPQTRVTNYDSEWYNDATTVEGAEVLTVPAESDEQIVFEIELAEHLGAPTSLGNLTILSSEIEPGTLYANSAVAFSPYNIELQHQWYRDGVAIAGATEVSYELTPDDAGAELTVKVTATTAETLETQTPANTTVVTSAIYSVPGTAFEAAPVPIINNHPVVGVPVTTTRGTWLPANIPATTTPPVTPAVTTTFKFVWFRDGDPISGAASLNYTPTVADLGSELTFAVTARRHGFTKTTRISLPSKVVVAQITAGTPTVSPAIPVFGQPVTVSPGTWGPDVEALTFTQQWFRDEIDGSVPIDGATGTTYTPGLADVGKYLSVKVTGTRTEYGDSRTPAATAGLRVEAATYGPATTAPTITGLGIVGQPYTATPGAYSPEPETVSYSWLRNDVVIDSATGLAYTPIAADAAKTITFRVTVEKPGYATKKFDVDASAPVVPLGTFTAPTPSIGGTAKVGATLTAYRGNWNPSTGANFVYQWRSGGAVISGATGATYTLQPSDLGDQISVRVTGSKTNYVSKTSAYSAFTAKVVAGTLASKTPTISGSAKVGKTLTAVTGAWGPTPVTFSYKWLRDGKTISGATKSTYTLTASDLKKAISVTVTGSKSGYTSAAKTTAKTAKVGTGALVAPKPVIKGTAKVGSKLTATTSGWGPGSVSKKYQWYNNGKKIKKATKSTYKLPSSAKGDKITVKVTGKKTGFATKTVASSAVKVAKK